MNKHATLRLLAVVAALALALVAVACGDDDDENSGGSADTTQEETMAESQPLELNGETTTLVLDPGTAKVLTDNEVKVAPVDPAAPDGDGIGFPITGGTVDSESLAGTIDHSGGLRFSAGGTNLEVTDFVVDTEAGTLTATAGGGEIPLLTLDLAGLERSMEGGAIVASGITAALTAEAAQALNDTFKVELFEEGLAIGDVTVTATAAS
ncbi:MAG TPA: HtaA domain-containing protein [Thermoleophilaceae bacterium]|jgi:Htaa|nr:HtaA domain-containing protein [Thermoleophilaceae bacterium]